MNVYRFTRCPHCEGAVEVGGEGMPTVMVHGGENADEVTRRINQREPILNIASDFCGCCGNKMPCGCSNPSPQFV